MTIALKGVPNMKSFYLALLIPLMQIDRATPYTKPLLVKFSYAHPVNNSSEGDCLLIYADGAAHLELREPHPQLSRNDLHTYDFSIDHTQLSLLRAILADTRLSLLREYKSFSPPLQSFDFTIFTMEISHAGKLKRLGYFAAPTDITQSEQDRIEWAQAESVMQPANQWYRSATSHLPKPSQSPAQTCNLGRFPEFMDTTD